MEMTVETAVVMTESGSGAAIHLAVLMPEGQMSRTST